MNLPFIRFFKKDKAEEGSVAVAPRPLAPTEKPTSERLGKTVLPNSSRIVGLELSGDFPILAPTSTPAQTVPATSRKISLGGNGSIAVGPKLPQSEPAEERTIALPLADLIPNLPSNLLKPVAVDPDRRILLQASEVERGMSTGHPTVLLRAIYKQAPEFFISEVPAADMREVSLPFAKVVEQFANFQEKFCLMKGTRVLLLGQDFLAATNIAPIYAAGYWIDMDKPGIHHPFSEYRPPY